MNEKDRVFIDDLVKDMDLPTGPGVSRIDKIERFLTQVAQAVPRSYTVDIDPDRQCWIIPRRHSAASYRESFTGPSTQSYEPAETNESGFSPGPTT